MLQKYDEQRLSTEAAFHSVSIKRCSKNMQPIYKRTPMLKFDFNKVANQLKATLTNQ